MHAPLGHLGGSQLQLSHFRLWIRKLGLEAQDFAFMSEELHKILPKNTRLAKNTNVVFFTQQTKFLQFSIFVRAYNNKTHPLLKWFYPESSWHLFPHILPTDLFEAPLLSHLSRSCAESTWTRGLDITYKYILCMYNSFTVPADHLALCPVLLRQLRDEMCDRSHRIIPRAIAGVGWSLGPATGGMTSMTTLIVKIVKSRLVVISWPTKEMKIMAGLCWRKINWIQSFTQLRYTSFYLHFLCTSLVSNLEPS